MTIARIEPERAFFYDGNRMMGWNKDDGPFWHGNGSNVEERLYDAIEGMAELHARLAAQESEIAALVEERDRLRAACRTVLEAIENDDPMAAHAAAWAALHPKQEPSDG